MGLQALSSVENCARRLHRVRERRGEGRGEDRGNMAQLWCEVLTTECLLHSIALFIGGGA